MAKKKGKKGKKEKAPTGPLPTTTATIIEERTKMLCPRMGDIYERNEQVEVILEVRILKSNILQLELTTRCCLILGCCRKMFN